MNILFHCIHDTTSLAHVADLAVALRTAGHSIAFLFARGRNFPKCERWCNWHKFPIVDRQQDFRADIMFVTDHTGWDRTSDEIVIDIGHGMASKGKYYVPGIEYRSDYVFVPGQYYADKVDAPNSKVVVVGMPKLDRVFDSRKHNDEEHDRPVVLVAPTFNPGYNCLEMVAPFLEGLAEQYEVIVKPHEHFFASEDTSDIKYWRRFFEDPPPGVNVYKTVFNIAELLELADVVVSDISSVVLEALALRIPVVQCLRIPVVQCLSRDVEIYFGGSGPTPEEVAGYHGSWPLNSGKELMEIVDWALSEPVPDTDFLLDYRGESIQRIQSILQQIQKGDL